MKTRISHLFFLLTLATVLNAVPASAQPRVVWTRVFGGYSGFDKGYYVEETDDLGFIIVGETYCYGAGGADVYLIKTDSLGLTQWARTYGGPEDDIGYCVQQTFDYGYIIAGYTKSFGMGGSQDIYLIKTDASGDTLWTRTHGEQFPDEAASVQQTGDGGYIVGGTTTSWGTYVENAFLLKTDGLGYEQWHNTYGISAYEEYGRCVDQTSDGGYVIIGHRWPYPYGEDWGIYMAKADAAGLQQWDEVYYYNELAEVCYSGQQTLDGGYILGGYTSNFGDMLLIKTDYLGQEQWSHTYGYGETITDGCYDVQQTWDGGYILTGQSYYSDNVYIVKTDYLGNQAWDMYVGDADVECGYSVKQIHDGGYIICGWYGGPWTWDVYLIRLAPEGVGVIPEGEAASISDFIFHPAAPNPFNPSTVISFELPVASFVKLAVFDVSGRDVRAHGCAPLGGGNTPALQYPAGRHRITFDGSGLPSGVYLARLTVQPSGSVTTATTAVQKLVLLK